MLVVEGKGEEAGLCEIDPVAGQFEEKVVFPVAQDQGLRRGVQQGLHGVLGRESPIGADTDEVLKVEGLGLQ